MRQFIAHVTLQTALGCSCGLFALEGMCAAQAPAAASREGLQADAGMYDNLARQNDERVGQIDQATKEFTDYHEQLVSAAAEVREEIAHHTCCCEVIRGLSDDWDGHNQFLLDAREHLAKLNAEIIKVQSDLRNLGNQKISFQRAAADARQKAASSRSRAQMAQTRAAIQKGVDGLNDAMRGALGNQPSGGSSASPTRSTQTSAPQPRFPAASGGNSTRTPSSVAGGSQPRPSSGAPTTPINENTTAIAGVSNTSVVASPTAAAALAAAERTNARVSAALQASGQSDVPMVTRVIDAARSAYDDTAFETGSGLRLEFDPSAWGEAFTITVRAAPSAGQLAIDTLKNLGAEELEQRIESLAAPVVDAVRQRLHAAMEGTNLQQAMELLSKARQEGLKSVFMQNADDGSRMLLGRILSLGNERDLEQETGEAILERVRAVTKDLTHD